MMKMKSAYHIYSIVILGCSFVLYSTFINYFSSLRTIPTGAPQGRLFAKDISTVHFAETQILERNIFNIEGTIPNEGQNETYTPRCATSVASTLPYDIVGILYGGNSKSSIAVLRNRNTGQVVILKQGSRLPEKGLISSIEADRVWILVTKCPEYIAAPKPKLPSSRVRLHRNQTSNEEYYSEPGFERSGTNTNVTREWVDDILTNKLSAVLNDALATPHLVNGQVDGFTMSNIEPSSVYDKIGLKDGDTVMSINDIPLTDAGQAIQTLNALKSETGFDMMVDRNGQKIIFKINVQQL